MSDAFSVCGAVRLSNPKRITIAGNRPIALQFLAEQQACSSGSEASLAAPAAPAPAAAAASEGSLVPVLGPNGWEQRLVTAEDQAAVPQAQVVSVTAVAAPPEATAPPEVTALEGARP